MAGGRVSQLAALSTGDAGASSFASTGIIGGIKGKELKNIVNNLDNKVDGELLNTQSISAGADASENVTATVVAGDDGDATPRVLKRNDAPALRRVRSLKNESASALDSIESSNASAPVRGQTPAPETTPVSATGLAGEQLTPSSQVPSSGVTVTPLIKRMQPGTNMPQIIMPGIARTNDQPETDGGDTDTGGDTDVEDDNDRQTTPRPRTQLSRRSRSTSTMSIVNASLPDIQALPMLSSQDPILNVPTSDLDVLTVAQDDHRQPQYGPPVRILIEDDHPMPPSSPTPGRRDSPKISLFQLPPSSPPRELWSSPPPQTRRLGEEDEDYDCEGVDLPFSSKEPINTHASHLRMILI
ncbi:hypothetical protein AX16_001131 [Volvariella volvacea WC 439]|nr:hypothetical protein AX16_001131 [Volvariella volvacea WC 439]